AGTARPDTEYRERAEPYRGGGPHRVEVNARYAPKADLELPAQWTADLISGGPRPRLVACVYQESVGTRKKLDDCLYTHLGMGAQRLSRVDPKHATKVALLKARYIIGLYEATTARPIDRIEVPGDELCPSQYEVDSGGSVFDLPDMKKLHAALRPYVERTVSA
ncbi:hypothetical protein ACFQ07_11400, partial [Actinomadura adrarensis]